MRKFVFVIVLFLTLSVFSQVSNKKDTSVINTDKFLFFDKYDNQHIGTFAPDFRMIINSNRDTVTLYNLKADSLIILFYDPDCSHCKKEIKHLRKDKKLNCLIAENKVIVLTIPPDIDFVYWQKIVHKLPKNWFNAYSFDNDLIIKKYLWKVPQIFVLDKDKRITYINMYREDLEY